MSVCCGWGIRGGLSAAVIGSCMMAATPAAAQPGPGGAAAELRSRLTQLAANPSSVPALIDAARASIDVGDASAALAFYSRANQLSPRNPRVKMGLASVNLRLGNPETALLLFGEAVQLGAAVSEIAADRGLAHDLLGQPARAQQDYLLALRGREHPETRRRLAVSLAISGQRDAALRLLDEQVRQNDRAGLRTRALVLALSGDATAASTAARSAVPPAAAQSMVSFFQRMAGLTPAQMASAAHLGRFPINAGSGTIRTASTGRRSPAPDQGALAFAGTGGPGGTLASSRLSIAPTGTGAGALDVRRRPGAAATPVRFTSPNSGAPRTQTASAAPASATPARAVSPTEAGRPSGAWSEAASQATFSTAAAPLASIIQPHPLQPLRRTATVVRITSPGASSAPAVTAQPSRQLAAATPPAAPVVAPAVSAAPATRQATPGVAAAAGATTASVQVAGLQPIIATPSQSTPSQAQPANAPITNFAAWNLAAPQTAVAPQTVAAPQAAAAPQVAVSPPRMIEPPRAAPGPARPGFSDVIAAVAALPTDNEFGAAVASTTPGRSPALSAPRRGTGAAAAGAQNASASRAVASARIWVQLATAARAALPDEFSRLRRRAPELFQGRSAHAAPMGGNSRLLVGPFASATDARAFVNRLNQSEIQSFSWTSAAGQQVERLSSGR